MGFINFVVSLLLSSILNKQTYKQTFTVHWFPMIKFKSFPWLTSPPTSYSPELTSVQSLRLPLSLKYMESSLPPEFLFLLPEVSVSLLSWQNRFLLKTLSPPPDLTWLIPSHHRLIGLMAPIRVCNYFVHLSFYGMISLSLEFKLCDVKSLVLFTIFS